MSILLTPARIGQVEIKNRIVMPPMTTRLADADGHVTDDTIAYYLARVRGGVRLITVEMASPERAGRHRHRELGIYDDRFLPGLSRDRRIHCGGFPMRRTMAAILSRCSSIAAANSAGVLMRTI
jgi:2,4-dienoyl-CoA reductase-like NADH-dependent reductase (Old Yellow Enzyme family)